MDAAPSPIALPSPSCATSPPALVPRISPFDPAAAVPRPAVTTHKEWIIPPRPKPGRKPATDTPPTKRKAQNRAAQRAFRERRAARVSELEDQIEELQQEKLELQRQNEELRRELLESRKAKAELQQVASPAPSEQDLSSGCCKGAKGGGGAGGGCCLKRPPPPPPPATTHKKRSKPNYEEIDFTATFSSSSKPQKPRRIDPCGFCSDGTPCVCAELDISENDDDEPLRLPPIASMLPAGGCAQCKSDPMSTLFCRTVVASSSSASQDIEEEGTAYIPCSAAYQALSRHKGFNGGEGLGDLVRPLKVRGEGGGGGEGCPQVEVSSVRDVLKMLDRRFGMD